MPTAPAPAPARSRGESGGEPRGAAPAADRAGFLDRALGAPAEAGGRDADVEDADPAEGVVEPHRIGRVEAGERVRDLAGGLPVGGAPPGQSESSRDPMDVRVRRDHEAGSRDAAPQPEVEVVAPDHPAQVEVPALARRARGRARKEEAHGGALGQPPDAEDRTVVEGLDARDGAREQGPGVPILGALRALEEAAQPAAAGLAGAGDREEERGRVARTVEAVAEPGQGVARRAPGSSGRRPGPGRAGDRARPAAGRRWPG